jgi:hypothetical protein
MMKRILLLIDYNSEFLIQLNDNNEYISMNINSLKDAFNEKGYELEVINFSELDYNQSFKGKFVLYQTSELIGQFYKKYIEDIVYYLENVGAIMLPNYEYLKAHHNKGFMELHKNSFHDNDLKSIKSKYFGSFKEACKYIPQFPVVVKKISGSGSDGVFLANNHTEYLQYLEKAMKTIISTSFLKIIKTYIKNFIKLILAKILKRNYRIDAIYVDRPVVVQNYISNLSGDYKVLYYGGKFYTLYRKNRKNDFRASGGGQLSEVPINENFELLNFAEKVTKEIDFPIIGMDIGFDGDKYHLIEYQMIHIGPYTLQRSKYYFLRDRIKWKCIKEESDICEEFVRSICEYIEKKFL